MFLRRPVSMLRGFPRQTSKRITVVMQTTPGLGEGVQIHLLCTCFVPSWSLKKTKSQLIMLPWEMFSTHPWLNLIPMTSLRITVTYWCFHLEDQSSPDLRFTLWICGELLRVISLELTPQHFALILWSFHCGIYCRKQHGNISNETLILDTIQLSYCMMDVDLFLWQAWGLVYRL